MLLQVSAGLAHTAIIDATGALYTLGWNQDGQLGVGDLRSRDRPTLVAGLLEQEDAVQVLAVLDWQMPASVLQDLVSMLDAWPCLSH